MVAAILAASRAQADPLDQCASVLPNGIAPIYLVAPVHHTELCHEAFATRPQGEIVRRILASENTRLHRY